MLSYFHYNQLPIDIKADELWEKGKFLSQRVYKNYGINLYMYSHFYIESWTDLNKNNLVKIEALPLKDLPNEYLVNINLESMIDG